METTEVSRETERACNKYSFDTTDGKEGTEKIGNLCGGAELWLHTEKARALVAGRSATKDKAGIVGLIGYGAMVRRIWKAAKEGDPYADYWLIGVSNRVEQGRKELEELTDDIKENLEGGRGVSIDVAASEDPVRVALDFGNPFGYMGAYLLGAYDEFVRVVLTARRVGVFERKESEKMLQVGGRKVRGAYASVLGWRNLGVRRSDLAERNGKAEWARKLMGSIPEDIAVGELRPRMVLQEGF